MSYNIYIARQPIVTADESIYGYELLFRDPLDNGTMQANIKDGMIATTRVAVNALNHIGIDQLVGQSFAFINIDHELLLDDAILSIPKERFVLELLENIEVSPAIISRVKELKALGYRFALDDMHCDENIFKNFAPLFDLVDIFKLDALLVNKEKLEENLAMLRSYKFQLLAEKVETKEEFEYYKDIGCNYFQGYFFAKPDLVSQTSLDPAFKDIFKLINLLDRDISTQELAKSFEASIDITVQLLRFMNSGFLHLKSDIRSIAHAITLLGKKPLKQWLLLIAFSKSDNGGSMEKSPIVTLAQSRARLMSELLQKISNSDIDPDQASFVGMLSLVDVITHTSLDVVLDELRVDSVSKDALLNHEGVLGTMLKFAKSLENLDISQANALLEELKLSNEALETAILESYKA